MKISKQLLGFSGVALTLLLCGCDIEYLYPTNATEEITIHKDGKAEVRYHGEFTDSYVIASKLFATMGIENDAKRVALPTRNEFVKTLTDRVQAYESGALHLKRISDDKYQIDYQSKIDLSGESGNQMIEDGQPEGLVLLSGFFYSSNRWESRQVGNWSDNLNELRKMEEDPQQVEPRDRRAFQAIIREIRNLRGTLIIRTDALVTEHNATATKKLDGGFTEYRWDIDSKNIDKTTFQADTSSGDELKIRTAKPGTRCMDIIGHNCKCGPFQLITASGKPKAYAKYSILTPTGEVHGCADKDGNVDAIMVETIGRCGLKYTPGECKK